MLGKQTCFTLYCTYMSEQHFTANNDLLIVHELLDQVGHTVSIKIFIMGAYVRKFEQSHQCIHTYMCRSMFQCSQQCF